MPPITLALVIAYLFNPHYAASTVNTYVSVIGYSHKMDGLPDPTKAFLITHMLKDYGKIVTNSLFSCSRQTSVNTLFSVSFSFVFQSTLMQCS